MFVSERGVPFTTAGLLASAVQGLLADLAAHGFCASGAPRARVPPTGVDRNGPFRWNDASALHLPGCCGSQIINCISPEQLGNSNTLSPTSADLGVSDLNVMSAPHRQRGTSIESGARRRSIICILCDVCSESLAARKHPCRQRPAGPRQSRWIQAHPPPHRSRLTSHRLSLTFLRRAAVS